MQLPSYFIVKENRLKIVKSLKWTNLKKKRKNLKMSNICLQRGVLLRLIMKSVGLLRAQSKLRHFFQIKPFIKTKENIWGEKNLLIIAYFMRSPLGLSRCGCCLHGHLFSVNLTEFLRTETADYSVYMNAE